MTVLVSSKLPNGIKVKVGRQEVVIKRAGLNGGNSLNLIPKKLWEEAAKNKIIKSLIDKGILAAGKQGDEEALQKTQKKVKTGLEQLPKTAPGIEKAKEE